MEWQNSIMLGIKENFREALAVLSTKLCDLFDIIP